MSNRLVRLITTAGSAAPRRTLASNEPLPVAAQNGWHERSRIEGDGYVVHALHDAERSAPARIGIRPIPLAGIGAGVRGLDAAAGDARGDGAPQRAVLRFEFAQPSLIRNLDLGLLFDGPEHADWDEAARFDVTFAGEHAPRSFTLYASYVNAGFASCSWDGSAVPWVSVGAWGGGPGLWLNTEPFGSRAVQRMDLHACAVAASHEPDGARTERSDFVFRSLEAIAMPDADTLARLGEDLGTRDLQRRRA